MNVNGEMGSKLDRIDLAEYFYFNSVVPSVGYDLFRKLSLLTTILITITISQDASHPGLAQIKPVCDSGDPCAGGGGGSVPESCGTINDWTCMQKKVLLAVHCEHVLFELREKKP
jgi:hypothetical protein